MDDIEVAGETRAEDVAWEMSAAEETGGEGFVAEATDCKGKVPEEDGCKANVPEGADCKANDPEGVDCKANNPEEAGDRVGFDRAVDGTGEMGVGEEAGMSNESEALWLIVARGVE